MYRREVEKMARDVQDKVKEWVEKRCIVNYLIPPHHEISSNIWFVLIC